MTDAISPDPATTEHGINPDQTPFFSALDLLLTAVSQWREKDQLPGQFILALAHCSQSDPDQAAAGFTPMEIRDAIRALRQGWLPDPTEDVSRRIRELFGKADALIRHKQEHLLQSARDGGYAQVPFLDRSSGGGSGHLTRYRIRLTPLAVVGGAPPQEPPPFPPFTGAIRYRCEESRSAGVLGNLAAGIDIRGWTKWIYLGMGVAGLLALLALCGLALLALVLVPKAPGTIPMLITATLILGIAWRCGFPLFQVIDARILSAPGWLQLLNVDEDLLLEWRRPPRHPERRLQLVRYSGTCPLCASVVRVKRRTWYASPTDLVGRCEEAPFSHRYSFDHITRCGRPLGHQSDIAD